MHCIGEPVYYHGPHRLGYRTVRRCRLGHAASAMGRIGDVLMVANVLYEKSVSLT